MAHPPLGAPPMYSEFDPSEQLPGPNQLPNPHFANLNLRSQLQSQEHSYPREHLQQYQHPTHASLTPFETGKRTPLYNEGISSEEIRQEENFVESTLQWIPPLPSNQTRQFPRLEVGDITLNMVNPYYTDSLPSPAPLETHNHPKIKRCQAPQSPPSLRSRVQPCARGTWNTGCRIHGVHG